MPKKTRPVDRQKLDSLPVLLTVKEAATYFSISDRTVRRHIDSGILQSERIGNLVRIRVEAQTA